MYPGRRRNYLMVVIGEESKMKKIDHFVFKWLIKSFKILDTLPTFTFNGLLKGTG